MLINVLEPEECRIAILEDGVLEELYIERTSHESYIGNIYKGRIVNIEPSIQAVFVDFGVGRNGFLHVSDVAPQYYRHILEGKPAPADPLLELPDMPVYEAPEDDEFGLDESSEAASTTFTQIETVPRSSPASGAAWPRATVWWLCRTASLSNFAARRPGSANINFLDRYSISGICFSHR
jgi:Ribonuclease G/E